MNTFQKALAAATFAATAVFASPALAQDTPPVVVVGEVKAVEVTVDDSGNEVERLVDLGFTLPGTRLVYVRKFTNTTGEPIRNFVLTNPLSPQVRLGPDADEGLQVSVDGGSTFASLAELSVTEEDGAQRTASHSDVTHIRWTIEVIEPGQSGQVQFPAIIR